MTKAGEYMGSILKDEKLTKIADSVKPDAKRRVYLPGIVLKEGVSYHIYSNSLGQIVLDPQITIPASEAWLFENKAALASIDQGMTESAQGKVVKRGSFNQVKADEV
jgi:hypothetical protein